MVNEVASPRVAHGVMKWGTGIYGNRFVGAGRASWVVGFFGVESRCSCCGYRRIRGYRGIMELTCLRKRAGSSTLTV